MAAEQVVFHAFIEADGVVIAHYRSVHTRDEEVPCSLWFDPNLSPNPVVTIGRAMLYGSVAVDNAEIVEDAFDIPGALVPRPGEDGWQLTPITEKAIVSEGVVASPDYDSANVMTIEEVNGR